MLVGGGNNPVDTSITTDGLVVGVHKDDLVVLVGGVLDKPVGVQDTQVATTATDTLLSSALVRPPHLQLVDTSRLGLTVVDSLGARLLAASTPDTDTEHNVALLRFVPKTAGLVHTGGVRNSVDGRQVPVLPRPHSEESPEDIGLLLFVKLL